MTQFFVAVPRGGRRTAGEQAADSTAQLLHHLVEGYAPFLGPAYDPSPEIRATAPNGHAMAVVWRYCGEPARIRVKGDFWTVSSGHDVSEKMLSAVRRRGPRLVYDRPVWGQYAVVFGERYQDRLTAWNTMPALESIFWATTPEYVFISNRPLLIALALAGGARSAIELSQDYLGEYLLYGYSVTGQSPFAGVRRISVDESLIVQAGEPTLGEVPPGLNGPLSLEHTTEEAVEAMTQAFGSAADRAAEHIGDRPLQLRLSGGKDSRLLLGLMRKRDVTVQAVTFGKPNDPDGYLSRVLAELAGVDHTLTAPRVAEGEIIADQVRTVLFESLGQPASEPHVARYTGPNPVQPREAIMLGQWPLFKGGMAKKMRMTSENIEAVVLRQGGPLVAPAVREPYDERMRQWIRTRTAPNDLAKLYHFAREFRSGPYIQAHAMHYSRDAVLAYPFCDAEVGAVSDSLTMLESVSQKVLFAAMNRIWPEVAKVPLDRSRWKFEISGPDPEWSGKFYEERYKPLPLDDMPAPPQTPGPGDTSGSTGRRVAAQILESPRLPLLQTFIDSEFWDAMVSTGRGDFVVPQGLENGKYVRYLWRILVADIWYSRSWVPA